jgi:hypothetical protein
MQDFRAKMGLNSRFFNAAFSVGKILSCLFVYFKRKNVPEKQY